MLTRMFNRHHAGLRNWLLQRLTALVMALYVLTMAIVLMVQQPHSYEAWKSLCHPVWVRAMTWAFFMSLMGHAWLGVRDILKDYVPSQRVRLVLQKVVAGSLLIYAVWSTFIVWKM